MDKIGKAGPTNQAGAAYGTGECSARAWNCFWRVEVALVQVGGHVGAREEWERVRAHVGLGVRLREMSWVMGL